MDISPSAMDDAMQPIHDIERLERWLFLFCRFWRAVGHRGKLGSSYLFHMCIAQGRERL